jgi:hypothetical protein
LPDIQTENPKFTIQSRDPFNSKFSTSWLRYPQTLYDRGRKIGN